MERLLGCGPHDLGAIIGTVADVLHVLLYLVCCNLRNCWPTGSSEDMSALQLPALSPSCALCRGMVPLPAG
jgi:hypothetical protein